MSEIVRRRNVLIAVLISALVLCGVASVAALSLTARRGRPDSVNTANGFEVYRPGWQSAMAKAGVEATFPVSPVSVSLLEVQGQHSFSATFTGEEITALLNLYRFQSALGSGIELLGARVAFPGSRRFRLAASASYGGSRYSAELAGSAFYEAGGIRVDGTPELSVQGFGIGGSRRDTTVATLVEYLNGYLDAARGLSVERAQITTAGVEVTGVAPDRIRNPAPLEVER